MAERIAPCRVCGIPVSEYAQACPKCGDPTAARYGHAKPTAGAMGTGTKLVLGVVALLILYGFLSAARRAPTAGPSSAIPAASSSPALAHRVKVVSFECISGRGRDQAKMTVVNNGMTTIEFTKAFVDFKDGAGKVVSSGDSYFSPHTIPMGATASATVYSNGSSASTCEPAAVQDREGAPVELQPQS